MSIAAAFTRPTLTATAERNHPDRRDARALCQTGAAVRPRQRVLPRGLRGACGRPATCDSPSRPSSVARGLSLAGVAQQQRRLGYYAAPTALADQHAPLLDRHRRRPLARRRHGRCDGCSRRPRLARCSPPATPRAATTSRCCSRRRRPNAWKAATASPAASRSAACRRCGPTSASTAWTRADPATPEDRARVHAARHRGLPHRADLGRARACARRGATTRSSTARSCPIATSRGSCPPAPRASTRSCSGCSPGRCSGSATSTTGSRAARST